jgi:hypothetical protein
MEAAQRLATLDDFRNWFEKRRELWLFGHYFAAAR